MNILRQFLKQYDKTVKFPVSHALPKPKHEFGYTLFKEKLFGHFCKTLKNIATDRYVFPFALSVTRSVVSQSKSFKRLVSKTIEQRLSIYDTAKCIAFTKIVTIIPQSVEFLIAIMTSDSKILAQVLFQNRSIVQLIGDVICPNYKCRGEKCLYLTSFAAINNSTYQCKQCEACSHELNILFRDQKLCVTLFCWTYCFRKKTKSDYQKEKPSPLMRQYIRQSKLSTTKPEEDTTEPVRKTSKILPYME